MGSLNSDFVKSVESPQDLLDEVFFSLSDAGPGLELILATPCPRRSQGKRKEMTSPDRVCLGGRGDVFKKLVVAQYFSEKNGNFTRHTLLILSFLSGKKTNLWQMSQR